MKTTRVKICGITNLEDAMTCVEAGADALGFIFVEKTPRFVTPEVVEPIIRALPPFVTPVGVFWNHPGGHVKAVAEACGLRALQFHGDEPPEDLTGYTIPVIKTIKLSGTADDEADVRRRVDQYFRHRVAGILIDSTARWSEGEPRRPVEWQRAGQLTEAGRVILSAGLTPDNVARAVSIARPYAVDVNSGVEAVPGRKDPAKVRRFVAEARQAG
ncbi:MAG: phosphoribosylanthranilate isomerase [Candidatus Rokuibacteriota bacterium]